MRAACAVASRSRRRVEPWLRPLQAATPPPAAATQAIATPLPALLTPTPAGSTLAGTSWIMSSLNGALPVADTTVTLAVRDRRLGERLGRLQSLLDDLQAGRPEPDLQPADGRDDDGVRRNR